MGYRVAHLYQTSDLLTSWGGVCTHCHAWPLSYDRRPSHPHMYNAGTTGWGGCHYGGTKKLIMLPLHLYDDAAGSGEGAL